MRCFVALWPSADLRDALARTVRPLIPADCRAVTPENYHLTLCFLGAVADERVPALATAIAALPVPPFSFALDTTGHFGRAAVAWVGPAVASADLAALRQRVAACVTGEGFECDTQVFTPHVTVARRCREAARAWEGPPLRWSVDGIVLCRSDGTDAGVRYAVVARTDPASVR